MRFRYVSAVGETCASVWLVSNKVWLRRVLRFNCGNLCRPRSLVCFVPTGDCVNVMRAGPPQLQQRRSRLWLLTALPVVAVIVGCTPATGFEPSPRPQTSTVDVLAYVVGETSRWPRIGTQLQAQIVDVSARSVCWVKYGRPDMFECWRWDDQWLLSHRRSRH